MSDFVQGLRKYPVGNFVSFPAEIMRTSTNIVETALKEINFKIQLPSGAIVQPYKSIGKQRLRGMALTTAVVPASIATGAAMLYDVGEGEARGKDVSDMLLRFAGSGGNTVGEKFQQYIGAEAMAGPSRTEKINQAAYC